MHPSPRPVSQVVKWTVAVLAAAIAVLTAALPPASAQPSERTRSAVERFTARQAGDSGAANPFALGADVTCLQDPGGDTAGDDGPVADPRADLLEVCVEYGDALSVRLRPAQATDPTSDPNWVQGFSSANLGIELDGDDELEYVVTYLNADGLRAVVTDPDLNVACSGTATFDGAWFVATDIPADCLGAPDSLSFFAGLFYDTDHADPQAPVIFDFAPDADYAVVDRDGGPAPAGRGHRTARGRRPLRHLGGDQPGAVPRDRGNGLSRPRRRLRRRAVRRCADGRPHPAGAGLRLPPAGGGRRDRPTRPGARRGARWHRRGVRRGAGGGRRGLTRCTAACGARPANRADGPSITDGPSAVMVQPLVKPY